MYSRRYRFAEFPLMVIDSLESISLHFFLMDCVKINGSFKTTITNRHERTIEQSLIACAPAPSAVPPRRQVPCPPAPPDALLASPSKGSHPPNTHKSTNNILISAYQVSPGNAFV
jgi:hypothetical protein